jgi:hypothetical protein
MSVPVRVFLTDVLFYLKDVLQVKSRPLANRGGHMGGAPTYVTTILTYTDVKRVLVIHGLPLPSARGRF